MDQQALLNCLQQAKDANCPQDQVNNFVPVGYVPSPKQWQFHAAARAADTPQGPTEIGMGGARGGGKALSLDTRIPTPRGWVTMGGIKIGDSVYSPDGSVSKVIGTSEIYKDHKCYDVVFSDGSVITADAEHLWQTFTKKDRRAFIKRTDSYRETRRLKRGKKHIPIYVGLNTKKQPEQGVRTTEEIKNTLREKNEINHSVWVSSPIQGEELSFPLHPYLLGAWLGDGHKDGGKITCFDEQILDEIRDVGYVVYPLKADGLYRIEGMTAIIHKMGLLKNKKIPEEYLRSSIQQRISLLQGLNDTDGCVTHDGCIEFTNTNPILSKQYYELACSLGIKVTMKESNATLYGRVVSKKWRIRYSTSLPMFLLDRKLNLQNKKTTDITRRRFIVEVRDRESVPTRCIVVNHPSHCFLAGESFIPTHNSHSIFAQAALDDAQRVPKLKILFIRKTAISAKESFGDLIDRILSQKVPHTISNNVIEFANGSRILLGGFHNDDDVEKYVGVEYDLIVIEELNQLTEEKVEKLKGSLRTSKPNWRPRMYTSFNPGGIGHNFVKSHFVLPHRLHSETTTRFIPATYTDNSNLNAEYITYLESLQGDLGRAWREGDFDLFAGQFFKEWSERIHVCEPFTIPDDWNRFFAFDYGFNHPLALGWFAVSPDGQLYMYRELHGSGMSYTQAAEEFVSMTMPNENLQYGACDPALWAKKGERDDILSGAEVFARRVGELTGHQPRLIKAENARVTGWGVVREYLRPYLGPENTLTAKFQVFSTCPNTIRTAPEQVHDDRVPEDMKKQDGDDCWDMIRYAKMSRPRPTHTPEQIAKREFDMAMKRKKQRLSTSGRLRFVK